MRNFSIACVFAMAAAQVFGMSGGRTGCWQGDVRYTAMHGTPEQLISEIDIISEKWFVANVQPVSFGFPVIVTVQKRPERANLRKIVVNLWEGCPGKLLDFAVAGGNTQNARLLLSLGADPAGRSVLGGAASALAVLKSESTPSQKQYGMAFESTRNIFRRCINAESFGYLRSSRDHFRNARLEVDQAARLTLFRELVNLAGAREITEQDANKYTALSDCEDPVVLKLLIELSWGVKTSCIGQIGFENCSSPLDDRVLKYLHQSYDENHRGIRLELLTLVAAAHPTKMLTKSVESNLCEMCRKAAKNDSVCNSLRGVINVRHPATLLRRDEYLPRLDPIGEARVCFDLFK